MSEHPYAARTRAKKAADELAALNPLAGLDKVLARSLPREAPAWTQKGHLKGDPSAVVARPRKKGKKR